jgi:hypothetical protein
MISVLTQNNGAIINVENVTSISIVATDDEKFAVVADQNYVLGTYENAQDAISVLTWIASELGEHTDSRNLCFTMPTNDFLHPTNDAEIIPEYEEEEKNAEIN